MPSIPSPCYLVYYPCHLAFCPIIIPPCQLVYLLASHLIRFSHCLSHYRFATSLDISASHLICHPITSPFLQLRHISHHPSNQLPAILPSSHPSQSEVARQPIPSLPWKLPPPPRHILPALRPKSDAGGKGGASVVGTSRWPSYSFYSVSFSLAIFCFYLFRFPLVF